MNINKIKNIGAFFVAEFLTLITFILSILSFHDLLISILITIFIMILGILLGRKLTKHPLTELIEGSGILVLKIDSTGIIKPLIARLNPPYLTTEKGGGLFDRKMSFYLTNPKNSIVERNENDNSIIIKEIQPKHYFAFENFYPVFVYNEQMKTFIDKEFLSKAETRYLIEHNLNYIKNKSEELSSILRDFARYIIEQTRPKPAFFASWWFWLIVIVLFIIVGIMLTGAVPSIIPSATPTHVQTTPVIPRT